ncbi:MAG: hypothetical protein ACTSRZ_20370 [Promethearchaeota archaeon]
MISVSLIGYIEILSNKFKNSDKELIEKRFKECSWKPYYGNKKDLYKYYMKEKIEIDYGVYEKIVKERNKNLEGLIYLPDLNGDGKVGR